ncbi:MAG: ABC transporter permease, partial [Oscillospiraceae bacterium]|nr:ABC transporter permease [Oscillospiraceae bacterium]
MTTVINFLCAAVLAGTPFLFGTVGEIITERSGNLNLGVEGMMFMGGVAGIAGAYFYEQSAANPIGWVAAIIAVVCSFVCAALGALVYSFLTVTLRANQNVTGLLLTIFGTGFGNFFGEVLGNKAGGYVVVTGQTKEAFSVG